MESGKLDRLVRIAMSVAQDIECSNRHVSFILDRNDVISIGTNSNRTHPLSAKYGYPLLGIHSELSAIIRAPKNIEFKKCRLINIRLSSDSWRYNLPIFRMSKPCKYCESWCRGMFKEIYYTTNDGFICL
jgi:hypothetical protein